MRLGNVYDSLPAGVSRADYRAISNFVVNELSYPVMESMVREPTGDTNRVIHGGYVYNFHERRCCSKTPHRVPYYLGGSDVYVYRCSQRNIHKRSQKSDNFNKTRNRWVRVDMHCQGHINVYFPSPEQGRLLPAHPKSEPVESHRRKPSAAAHRPGCNRIPSAAPQIAFLAGRN